MNDCLWSYHHLDSYSEALFITSYIAVSSKDLEAKVHPKLLISQSKFSGARKLHEISVV